MRYKQYRHSKFPLQLQDEANDLCLNCHVKGCCRFIGYQQLGLTAQCHRDQNSLAHSSTALKWIKLHYALRIRKLNSPEERQSFFFGLAPVTKLVVD
jgi:hypothetical protein